MNKETFLAKTFSGIEPVLCKELEDLGALNCKILKRAVSFQGDMELLYKANYFCRTALRILWQKKTFEFKNNQQFYDAVYHLPIEDFLEQDGTLAVSATISESIFNSPLFASVLVKDAVCDRFRNLYNERPSVDKDCPDLQIHIHVHKENAVLYFDSSGESLHKRGYKMSNHPASINEVLAAAMLRLAQWDGQCDFIDPMCGGGTLLIEAAMTALHIPAGFYRDFFGFFSWKNFRQELWDKVIDSAEIKSDVEINFYGYDISPRYLGMARANVANAKLSDFIYLKTGDIRDTKSLRTPAYMMINPPYDQRLEEEDIYGLYQDIGDTWKKNYAGCNAFIISSHKDALKHLGLRSSQKFTLYNGPLECKFLKFELYQGSKEKSCPITK